MGGFKKWGDTSNGEGDFEMGRLIPLHGLWLNVVKLIKHSENQVKIKH